MFTRGLLNRGCSLGTRPMVAHGNNVTVNGSRPIRTRNSYFICNSPANV